MATKRRAVGRSALNRVSADLIESALDLEEGGLIDQRRLAVHQGAVP